MHVGSELITLICRGINTIHTMTHAGDLVNIVKNNGYPRLCHTGSDAVLVAEWWRNRLELQVEGNSSHVLLEPEPRQPRDAVYIGGAVFVLSVLDPDFSKYRKAKYVAK